MRVRSAQGCGGRRGAAFRAAREGVMRRMARAATTAARWRPVDTNESGDARSGGAPPSCAATTGKVHPATPREGRRRASTHAGDPAGNATLATDTAGNQTQTQYD